MFYFFILMKIGMVVSFVGVIVGELLIGVVVGLGVCFLVGFYYG